MQCKKCGEVIVKETTRTSGRLYIATKIAKLIGGKCFIKCHLNGARTEALYDTGAQVTIISEDWRQRNLPDSTMLPISDLLEGELSLNAANGTEITFPGRLTNIMKNG